MDLSTIVGELLKLVAGVVGVPDGSTVLPVFATVDNGPDILKWIASVVPGVGILVALWVSTRTLRHDRVQRVRAETRKAIADSLAALDLARRQAVAVKGNLTKRGIPHGGADFQEAVSSLIRAVSQSELYPLPLEIRLGQRSALESFVQLGERIAAAGPKAAGNRAEVERNLLAAFDRAMSDFDAVRKLVLTFNSPKRRRLPWRRSGLALRG